MSHTYGSVSRAGVRASTDAEAVALLRKAGAIPLCVTNVSEQVRQAAMMSGLEFWKSVSSVTYILDLKLDYLFIYLLIYFW